MDFTAMIAHLALVELPIVEPLIQDRQLEPAAEGMLAPTTTNFAFDFQRGRKHFHDLGCAGCHVPMMVLKSPIFDLDGLPPIDLSREMRGPALTYDSAVATRCGSSAISAATTWGKPTPPSTFSAVSRSTSI